jgi:hypothetical protein
MNPEQVKSEIIKIIKANDGNSWETIQIIVLQKLGVMPLTDQLQAMWMDYIFNGN